jgi:acetyl-CoA decarbonylase/synthase complex subunit delta
LAFQVNTVKYSGKINVTPVGAQKINLGGQAAFPFYDFEGALPNKPKLALQIWDLDPGESISAPLAKAYEGALGDPGAWAKKAVEYGADIVCLTLKSSDPNDQNTGPAEAIAVVQKVLDAINVPLIVFGVDNKDKDIETLSAVAEKFAGKNLVLGPITDKNYKQIGAQALAYGHTVIARSPIDVNLAKQLNILLMDLGIKPDKILIDPNTGGLGYGMEYCYSVMERLQAAALLQADDKLQQPIINMLGEEIWKTKEANTATESVPTLGDQTSRGVLMEVTEAVSLLAAGTSLLVLSHPESLKLVRYYIDLWNDGGEVKGEGFLNVPITPISAEAIAAIQSKPKAEGEPKAKEAPKSAPKEEPKPAPKAAEAPKPAPKAAEAPKPAPPAPKEEPKPAPKAAEAPKPAAEAPKPAPKAAEAPKPAAKPTPVRSATVTRELKPAPQSEQDEKEEYVVSNAIIAELSRVHVRVPRY